MEERLKKILRFLIRYSDNEGRPPTIRDIGEAINVDSTSQISYYLKKLEDRRMIQRSDHSSRSIQVTEDGYKHIGINPKRFMEKVNDFLWNVPLCGRIVASEPIPMPDQPFYDPSSTIDVPRSLFAITENVDDLFALEVDGDSMIDAMINDGDIVILRRTTRVNNGEMAAIWIDDDNETTLKYFYKESDHYRLRPANPTMEDIIISQKKNVRVMGKVVAVVRQVVGYPTAA
ncbi:MAG: repressor LexA [Anaerolineaceae bacterium]|nr:repressor LexA [Anaerolineaceae bacterium]